MLTIPSTDIKRDRVVALTLHGAKFVIQYERDDNEAPDGTPETAFWIDAVRFGDTWFSAAEALGDDLAKALDSELQAHIAAERERAAEDDADRRAESIAESLVYYGGFAA